MPFGAQLEQSISSNHLKFIEQIRKKGQFQVQVACDVISVVLLVNSLYSYLAIDFESMQHFHCMVSMQAITAVLVYIMRSRYMSQLQYLQFGPIIVNFVAIIMITEKGIFENPYSFKLEEGLIGILSFNDFTSLVLMTEKRYKLMSNILMWGYFLARNFNYYGSLPIDLMPPAAIYLTLNYFTAKIYDQYLQKISSLYYDHTKIVNQQLQDTLEMIPQGVLVLDVSTEDITYANQELIKLLNIEDSHHIKDILKHFYFSEEQQLNESSIQKEESKSNSRKNTELLLLNNQHKVKPDLLEYLTSKGSHQVQSKQDYLFKRKLQKQYVQIKAQLILDNKLVTIFNDISRIKDLEKTSQKIKAMFFQSMAHELRTPLNSIIPLAQKLEEQTQNTRKKKYIKIILSGAYHLQHLIEDALDMTNFDSKKFELVKSLFDIRKAIKDVVSVIEFQAEQKKIDVQIQISPTVPMLIKSDEKRYKQVLFNLLGNAIKFTFQGYIRIYAEFIDNYIITEIQDTGIGIEPEIQCKIFQYFGQPNTKSKYNNNGGIGLGLSISKMIVSSLNGEISAQSDLNKGSIFTFKIKVDGVKDYIGQKSMNVMAQGELFDQSIFETEHQREQRSSNPNNSLLLMKSESNYEWDFNTSDADDVYKSPENNLSKYLLNFSRNQQSLLNPLSRQPVSQFIDDLGASALLENIQLQYNTATTRPGISVLIVDDSPYNLIVLEELLKEIQVITKIKKTLNGLQALQKIQSTLLNNAKCSFNFILMDLHMPILDGFQTIEKLRSMEAKSEIDLSSTKIIAVSAITSSQFRSHKNHTMFDDFMEKPVTFPKLNSLFI